MDELHAWLTTWPAPLSISEHPAKNRMRAQQGSRATNEPGHALEALYADWRRTIDTAPDTPLADIRAMFEHWGDVTAEPAGVSYHEIEAGGRPALWAIPDNCAADRVLLCLHGGGYVLASMRSHRKLYGHIARAVGCRALIPEYRRAPEHPHPAQVTDVVQAYDWLLSSEGISPEHVAFVGDSAGGALAITALLLARDRGMQLPAASVPIAPYVDTEALGASYVTNATHDRLGARDATLAFMALFLGENGDRHDPLANPLRADLRGLPPMLVQVGGHDVLVDDSRQFHERARAHGVDVILEIAPGQQHVFHFMAGSDQAADAAIARIAAWLRPILTLAPGPGITAV
jgi:acetyl esterase/lipase